MNKTIVKKRVDFKLEIWILAVIVSMFLFSDTTISIFWNLESGKAFTGFVKQASCWPIKYTWSCKLLSCTYFHVYKKMKYSARARAHSPFWVIPASAILNLNINEALMSPAACILKYTVRSPKTSIPMICTFDMMSMFSVARCHISCSSLGRTLKRKV